MDSQQDVDVLRHLLFQVADYDDDPTNPILRSLKAYGITCFTTLIGYHDSVYDKMFYHSDTGAVLQVKRAPTKILQNLVRFIHLLIMDNGGVVPPVASLMAIDRGRFLDFACCGFKTIDCLSLCSTSLKTSFETEIKEETEIEDLKTSFETEIKGETEIEDLATSSFGSTYWEPCSAYGEETEEIVFEHDDSSTPTLGHVDWGDAFFDDSLDLFDHGLSVQRNMIRRVCMSTEVQLLLHYQADLGMPIFSFNTDGMHPEFLFLTIDSHTQWDPGKSFPVINLLGCSTGVPDLHIQEKGEQEEGESRYHQDASSLG